MRILIAFFVVAVLPGCAANMAVNGNNGPDMAVVEQQHTRADVERLLGVPDETVSHRDGETVELYVVEAHTKPNGLRAAGHVTADVMTAGLWELAGGPIEAHKGRPQRVLVRYDEDDHVKSITGAPKGRNK
jgi:hypothetical protein